LTPDIREKLYLTGGMRANLAEPQAFLFKKQDKIFTVSKASWNTFQ